MSLDVSFSTVLQSDEKKKLTSVRGNKGVWEREVENIQANMDPP